MSCQLRGMQKCAGGQLFHHLHSKPALSAGWRRIAIIMMAGTGSSAMATRSEGGFLSSTAQSSTYVVPCRSFSYDSTPTDSTLTPQWQATESIGKPNAAAQHSESDGDTPSEVQNIYDGFDLYATNVLTAKLSVTAVHQGLPEVADITVVDTRKLKSSRHRVPPRAAIRRILAEYQKYWKGHSSPAKHPRNLVIVVKSDLVTAAKAQKLHAALSTMIAEASKHISVAVLVSRRSLRIGHLFLDTAPESALAAQAEGELNTAITDASESSSPREDSSNSEHNDNNDSGEVDPQEGEAVEASEEQGSQLQGEESLDDDFSRLAQDEEAHQPSSTAEVEPESLQEETSSSSSSSAEENDLSSGEEGEQQPSEHPATTHTPEEEEEAVRDVAQQDDAENSDNSEDDSTEACIADEVNDNLALDAEVQGEISLEEIREHLKKAEEVEAEEQDVAIMEDTGVPRTPKSDIEEEKKVDDYEAFLQDHCTAEQEECVPQAKSSAEREAEVTTEEEAEKGEAYEEVSQELSAAAAEEPDAEVLVPPPKSAEEQDVEIPPAEVEETTPGPLEATTVAEMEVQSFIADVRDVEQTQPEAPEIKEEVDPAMLEGLERALEVEEVEEFGKEHVIPQDVDEKEEKQGNERTPLLTGDDGNGAAESFVYLSTTPVGCRPLASRAVQSRQSEHLIDTSPFLPFFAYSFASTATERKVTKAKGTADALRHVLLSRKKKFLKHGEDIDVTELLARDAEDETPVAGKRGRPSTRRFPRVVHSVVPPPSSSSFTEPKTESSSPSSNVSSEDRPIVPSLSSPDHSVPSREEGVVGVGGEYEKADMDGSHSRHSVSEAPVQLSWGAVKSASEPEPERKNESMLVRSVSSSLPSSLSISEAEKTVLGKAVASADPEPKPIAMAVEHPFPPEPASLAPRGGLPIGKLPLELESSFPPTNFDVIEKIIKEVQDESEAPPRKRRSSPSSPARTTSSSSSEPLTAVSMKNNQLFVPDTTRTTLPTPLILQYDTFSNFLIKTLDSSENPSIRKALEEKKLREKAEEEKLNRVLAGLPKVHRQMTAGHILQKMVARRRRRDGKGLSSSVKPAASSLSRKTPRPQPKRRVSMKETLVSRSKAPRAQAKKKRPSSRGKKVLRTTLTKSSARKFIRRLVAKRKR